MKPTSILNDVVGPVMHGPSSSHTAASNRIGLLARSLLGEPPVQAEIIFDRQGSYAQVFKQQGSDLAFACGLLGWELTDPRFFTALDLAPAQNLEIRFKLEKLSGPSHPNTVELNLSGQKGKQLRLLAQSVGGGAFRLVELGGWPLEMDGQAHEVVILTKTEYVDSVLESAASDGQLIQSPLIQNQGLQTLVQVRRRSGLDPRAASELKASKSVNGYWAADPLLFIIQGQPLFEGVESLTVWTRQQGISLSEAALRYEREMLGLPRKEIVSQMAARWEIMQGAVAQGLAESKGLPDMRVLQSTAHKVFQAEARGELALGGAAARAAARALAVMEVNSAMGLVCAAPTGGSCGVLPGALSTLAQEKNLEPDRIIKALFAAGAVGLIFLWQGGTFAAEVAGCQVEIGLAGAMAAAAVVEAVGGSAGQACQAAAIALQNTVGLVCDPVQGAVEIPCHTRNAAAAASAFVCADLILGGYENPIPLDQTVDASLAVGCSLPPELRCTACGGLAVTPAAKALGLGPSSNPADPDYS
jgi:L-serine dehydratase